MGYDSTDFVVTETPVRDPKSITDPRERVACLRDFLRELPAERFDMREVGHWSEAGTGSCGSAACIGGWARAIFGRSDNGSVGGIDWVGPNRLGLSEGQTTQLFYPFGHFDANPAQAANVLDNYLATGRIDWSVA